MCGGAKGRRGLLPRDQEAAPGMEPRGLKLLIGWLLLEPSHLSSRNPEALTQLMLLEPVLCAVAYSPPQLLTAAANRPEAGKKCCISLLQSSLQPALTEPNQKLAAGKGAWEM